MEKQKLTVLDIKQKKDKREKISMLTAYDYGLASLLDEEEIDVILVGDSVGMVMLGYDSTVEVSMEEMLHHCKAVSRGVNRALIIGDMPFMSFNVSIEETIKNAGRFIKEGGCEAVKLEGGEEISDKVEGLDKAGIPVLGHIGLTPQTVTKLGGYKVQGKSVEKAKYLIRSSKALEKAGCFGIVLECVPSELSKIITEKIEIPTIGIGAGANCDGQVLVTQDLLGMYGEFMPKFVKRYTNLRKKIKDSIKEYKKEVRNREFPSQENEFSMPENSLAEIKKFLEREDK